MKNIYKKRNKNLKSLKMALLSSLSLLALNSASMAMIGDARTSFEEYYDYGRKQTGVVSIIQSKREGEKEKNFNGTGFLLETEDPNLKGRVIVTVAHILSSNIENVTPKYKIQFLDENYEEKWVQPQSIYIHPSYVEDVDHNDNSKIPDLAFILLKDPIDTSIFKPLKMNLTTHLGKIKDKEISVYGMSPIFGTVNDRFILSDISENILRRGFKAIINGPQTDYRQSINFVNSDLTITISQIDNIRDSKSHNYNKIMMNSKKENIKWKSFLKESYVKSIKSIKKQKTELVEHQNNVKKDFFDKVKGYFVEDNKIELIWDYLSQRDTIQQDLFLNEEEKTKKLIDFDHHKKDLLLKSISINEDELNIAASWFNLLKNILKNQSQSVSDLILEFKNGFLSTNKKIFQDVPEFLKYPKHKQKPEKKDSFVSQATQIFSMEYDSSERDQKLQNLQQTNPDLDIEKVNQAIDEFLEDPDLPPFIQIGNYILNFNFPMELSGFTTGGDSGGAVVHQNEAIGIITSGFKIEKKPNLNSFLYTDTALKIQDYLLNLTIKDEVTPSVSDSEEVSEVTPSVSDSEEVSEVTPSVSDSEEVSEVSSGISDSEEISKENEVSFVKDHENYFELAQKKLHSLDVILEFSKMKLDRLEKYSKEEDLLMIKLIKDFIKQNDKQVLEYGQSASSSFLPFSLQADWIQQTLKNMSMKVYEEKAHKEKIDSVESQFDNNETKSLSDDPLSMTSSESNSISTDSDVEESSLNSKSVSNDEKKLI